MARLRASTAEHHARAEGRRLEQALAAGSLPRDIFVAWLGQRFAMHTLLEPAVARLVASDARMHGLIPAELYQAANLRADLQHFGLNEESLDPCRAAAEFVADIKRTEAASPVGLLGHFYVFEGSKNGARMIARVAGPAYGITSERGMRYLDPHGSQQRTLWAEFKARMDAIDFTARELDAMVAAAGRTFDFVSAVDDELYAAS